MPSGTPFQIFFQGDNTVYVKKNQLGIIKDVKMKGTEKPEMQEIITRYANSGWAEV